MKTSSEPTVYKCSRCGAETILEGFYQKARRSFSRKHDFFCPGCWNLRTIKKSKGIFWQYIIMLIVGLFLLYVEPTSWLGWLFLNLFLFNLFAITLVIPHEIAHALTGQLLGMKVYKIVIGIGSTVFSKKLFGWQWEVKAIPFGGLTFVTDNKDHLFRTRLFFMVLAGPLISVLVLILLLVGPGTGIEKGFTGGLNPLIAFFMADVLTLVITLWPAKMQTAIGKHSSDGRALIEIPFLKRKEIEEKIVAHYTLTGAEYRKQGRMDDARKCYEEGLSRFPNNPANLNDMGILYLMTGEPVKAHEIFDSLALEKGLDDLKKAIFKNNIAYAGAVSGRADLLAEADTYSNEVLKEMPWFNVFKGTRGTVLVEMGRLDEGLALLREAFDVLEYGDSKCACACYLAIAEARKGNISKAREYYQAAYKLVSSNFLLEKAAKEITEAA